MVSPNPQGQGGWSLADLTMNIQSFGDVDINNKGDVMEFLDLNAMAHETIFTALLAQGLIFEHYPLWSPQGITTDWLLIHNQVHKDESIALGLDEPVGLDSVDPKDPGQMNDWLQNHYLDHQYKAQALGL